MDTCNTFFFESVGDLQYENTGLWPVDSTAVLVLQDYYT